MSFDTVIIIACILAFSAGGVGWWLGSKPIKSDEEAWGDWPNSDDMQRYHRWLNDDE